MLRQPEIPGPAVQLPTVRRETEPRRTRISDVWVRACATVARNSACSKRGEREGETGRNGEIEGRLLPVEVRDRERAVTRPRKTFRIIIYPRAE